MTAEEIEALQRRVQEKAGTRPERIRVAKAVDRVKDRGMNKTERRYEVHLRALEHLGDVLWYGFEPLKLRLADNTYYTPDFLIVNRQGEIEAHDVKAYWKKLGKVGATDDAIVKMKVAAEQFPIFRVLMTWEHSGQWQQRVF